MPFSTSICNLPGYSMGLRVVRPGAAIWTPIRPSMFLRRAITPRSVNPSISAVFFPPLALNNSMKSASERRA